VVLELKYNKDRLLLKNRDMKKKRLKNLSSTNHLRKSNSTNIVNSKKLKRDGLKWKKMKKKRRKINNKNNKKKKSIKKSYNLKNKMKNKRLKPISNSSQEKLRTTSLDMKVQMKRKKTKRREAKDIKLKKEMRDRKSKIDLLDNIEVATEAEVTITEEAINKLEVGIMIKKDKEEEVITPVEVDINQEAVDISRKDITKLKLVNKNKKMREKVITKKDLTEVVEDTITSMKVAREVVAEEMKSRKKRSHN
jgi:hypothetical protein